MCLFTKQLRSSALLTVLLLAGCHTDRASAGELDRIVEVLAIRPGMTVADVGAGDGDWSLAIAERVGRTGRVIATEVDQDELRKIEQRVEAAGLSNITALLGHQEDAGLPEGCCDAILLRMVYHHFVDPPAMLGSLRRAMRPGGRLAVIDITPQTHWRRLQGVPERGGHGIPTEDQAEAVLRHLPEDLIDEISEQGFELVARHEDWNGDRDRFCVVFQSSSQQPIP